MLEESQEDCTETVNKGRNGILALREIIRSKVMSFLVVHFKDVDLHSERKGETLYSFQ